jgi:hypothetical protein
MRAAHFTLASSQTLSIADGSQTGFDPGTSDFSAVCWIYPDSLPVQQAIFGKGASADTNTTTAVGYRVMVLAAGTLNITFSDTANATRLFLNTAAGLVAAGAWTHLAFVFTRASNLVCYVNGSAQSGLTISTRAGTLDSTAPFGLGCSGTSTGALANPFDGAIDTFGFWGRALTAADVTALYASGIGLAYRDLSAALKTNLTDWNDLDDAGGSGAVWLDRTGLNPLTAGTTTAAPTSTVGKR